MAKTHGPLAVFVEVDFVASPGTFVAGSIRMKLGQLGRHLCAAIQWIVRHEDAPSRRTDRSQIAHHPPSRVRAAIFGLPESARRLRPTDPDAAGSLPGFDEPQRFGD